MNNGIAPSNYRIDIQKVVSIIVMSEEEIPARKIVFLGDAAVGKTSILIRQNEGTFGHTSQTTTPSCFKFPYTSNGRRAMISFWDTAGQEVYQSMTKLYLRNAFGAILVFDITARKSFESLENWFRLCNDANPPPQVIFVVGNKSDMENERQVTREAAEHWATEHNAVAYVEVSALNGDGFHELFPYIGEQTLNTIYKAVEGVAVGVAASENSRCC